MKKFIYKLISSEKSPQKLASSFCCGIFIAWTPVIPVIPVQTFLIFLLSWFFRLNTTVTFATVYLINNPITMIPICVADYMFGSWLLNKLLNINMLPYNPHWIDSFSAFLNKHIDLARVTGGGPLCLWYLVIGGLVLPIILSIVMYPIMRVAFSYLIKKLGRHTENTYENHSTK